MSLHSVLILYRYYVFFCVGENQFLFEIYWQGAKKIVLFIYGNKCSLYYTGLLSRLRYMVIRKRNTSAFTI